MRVLITGATGMLGQGVLRQCLLDAGVDEVVVLGRSATGCSDPKLREILHSDLMDLTAVEPELDGVDAVFFCLGVSSAGMDKKAYRHITYDYTLSIAQTVARLNPDLTFVYVSGAGTDSTEGGRVAWARVKGETENAVMRLIPRSYMFRPGIIRPVHGAVSKTRSYRIGYAVAAPIFPLVQRIAPNAVTTTEQIGIAMLAVAAHGASNRILTTTDINALRAD